MASFFCPGCDGEWLFYFPISVPWATSCCTWPLVLQENCPNGATQNASFVCYILLNYTVSNMWYNVSWVLFRWIADLLLLLQEYYLWTYNILLWGICWIFWAISLWWLVYAAFQRCSYLSTCYITWSIWARCFCWNLLAGMWGNVQLTLAIWFMRNINRKKTL